MSADAIRRLADAPVMDGRRAAGHRDRRPASCSSRPPRPPWPSPPVDCPSWFLSVQEHGSCSEAPSKFSSAPCWENWDLDVTTEGSNGTTACEAGTCFFIDVHIELGGANLAGRTVFGNPPNDATGSKGTFFIYDPSVDIESDAALLARRGPIEEPSPWLIWVALGLGALLLVGCCALSWCLGWGRRGAPAAGGAVDGKPLRYEADALLGKAMDKAWADSLSCRERVSSREHAAAAYRTAARTFCLHAERAEMLAARRLGHASSCSCDGRRYL